MTGISYKNIWAAIFYLWLTGVYILMSMSYSGSGQEQNESGFRFDYLLHFLLYAIIPILYFFAEGAGLKKIFKENYYLILLGLLFAILTEIQQYYIPGRSFNPIDLGLNVTGFISGIFLGRFLHRKITGRF
ncbi:MAG: VanZ family protein [Bacteroidota bacterium]